MRNRKDLFKTIGAVLLIIVIVAGAFIYGNSKHQSDQTSTTDQTTQEQTTDSTTDQSQTDQSQSTSDQSSSSSQSATGSSQSAPQTGGTAESTPQTGPEMFYIIPAAGMAELGRRYVRSRKAIKQASLR